MLICKTLFAAMSLRASYLISKTHTKEERLRHPNKTRTVIPSEAEESAQIASRSDSSSQTQVLLEPFKNCHCEGAVGDCGNLTAAER